jgi:hypothetical protein
MATLWLEATGVISFPLRLFLQPASFQANEAALYLGADINFPY